MRLVCLPIQPRPALRANAFSSTGAAIDEHSMRQRRAVRLNLLGQLGEPTAQHLVIVAAQRVARDITELRVLQDLVRVLRVRR